MAVGAGPRVDAASVLRLVVIVIADPRAVSTADQRADRLIAMNVVSVGPGVRNPAKLIGYRKKSGRPSVTLSAPLAANRRGCHKPSGRSSVMLSVPIARPTTQRGFRKKSGRSNVMLSVQSAANAHSRSATVPSTAVVAIDPSAAHASSIVTTEVFSAATGANGATARGFHRKSGPPNVMPSVHRAASAHSRSEKDHSTEVLVPSVEIEATARGCRRKSGLPNVKPSVLSEAIARGSHKKNGMPARPSAAAGLLPAITVVVLHTVDLAMVDLAMVDLVMVAVVGLIAGRAASATATIVALVTGLVTVAVLAASTVELTGVPIVALIVALTVALTVVHAVSTEHRAVRARSVDHLTAAIVRVATVRVATVQVATVQVSVATTEGSLVALPGAIVRGRRVSPVSSRVGRVVQQAVIVGTVVRHVPAALPGAMLALADVRRGQPVHPAGRERGHQVIPVTAVLAVIARS